MSRNAIVAVTFFCYFSVITVAATWGTKDDGSLSHLLFAAFTLIDLLVSIVIYQSEETPGKDPKSDRMLWLYQHTIFPVGLVMICLTLALYMLTIGLIGGILEQFNNAHNHIVELAMLTAAILDFGASAYIFLIIPT